MGCRMTTPGCDRCDHESHPTHECPWLGCGCKPWERTLIMPLVRLNGDPRPPRDLEGIRAVLAWAKAQRTPNPISIARLERILEGEGHVLEP